MIEEYRFGIMRIAGRTYSSDLKIIKGRVVPEWWRGRGHFVDVMDVEDILAAEPEALVLGCGASNLVRVSEPLKKRLARIGAELHTQPTARAVETFNRLFAQGKNVAGAFHLGC